MNAKIFLSAAYVWAIAIPASFAQFQGNSPAPVGVNSNANNPNGVGAGTTGPTTPIYNNLPAGATIPTVVPAQSNPTPGSDRVNSTLRQISITFDQPMDTGLFYWPLPVNDPNFPRVTRDPYWTNSNRTVVLEVSLAPNTVYNIPINVSQLIFRSAQGVYAQPGYFRFRTAASGQGGGLPAGLGQNGSSGVVATPRTASPYAVQGTRRGSLGVGGARNSGTQATGTSGRAPVAAPVAPAAATPVPSAGMGAPAAPTPLTRSGGGLRGR